MDDSDETADANRFRQYDTAATVETIIIMDLGIVGEEEVSVKAITDTNTSAAKKSFISPPSCADESDDSHDTLGIHYEDEPRTGGVLPDATKSVGSIFQRLKL